MLAYSFLFVELFNEPIFAVYAESDKLFVCVFEVKVFLDCSKVDYLLLKRDGAKQWVSVDALKVRMAMLLAECLSTPKLLSLVHEVTDAICNF